MIGATAPWHPGVAEGHNDRIAWSAEPFDADTQDVYVEKLNPANPRQVEDGGRWVDIDARKDWIAVRGRKTPVDFTTETTRHGVIVASDLERHLAFAIRWSGSEPGAAAELAAPALDRAASSAEFRSALARWKMPARRMTYVDADGGRGSAVAALRTRPARLERRDAGSSMDRRDGDGATTGRRVAAAARRARGGRRDAARFAARSSRSRRRTPAEARAASSLPDSLTGQRAALVDALADALRERTLPRRHRRCSRTRSP